MTGAAAAVPSVKLARTSDLLRGILLANPTVEVFTVGQILDCLGADRSEASLIFFSMQSIVPAPDLPSLGGLSSGLIAGQMAVGGKTTRLPAVLLNRKVPRRSLAVAIHALSPVIEAAEKLAKPRLRWACCPLARRVLGLLLFVLAVAIAFPVIGFDPLHAASISIISLGLLEQDGMAVLFGVVAGLISLALIMSSGLTAKILKSKMAKWLRKFARKMGLRAVADMCERRGWPRLAAILRFEWQDLLLTWDPEKRAAEKHARAEAARKAAAAKDHATKDVGAKRRAPGRSTATPNTRPPLARSKTLLTA